VAGGTYKFGGWGSIEGSGGDSLAHCYNNGGGW
jgi:hypothetical protein